MNSAVPLSQQFLVVIIILLSGLLTGLLLDLSRALNKALHWPRSALFLVDLLLFLVAALVMYQLLFTYNQGEVRFYVYLCFVVGFSVYYLFYSRYLYKSMLHTLKYVLRLWQRVKNIYLQARATCCRLCRKLRKTSG